MSDSVRPHRRQPTRLLCPQDSPGKNTGVGVSEHQVSFGYIVSDGGRWSFWSSGWLFLKLVMIWVKFYPNSGRKWPHWEGQCGISHCPPLFSKWHMASSCGHNGPVTEWLMMAPKILSWLDFFPLNSWTLLVHNCLAFVYLSRYILLHAY